MNEKDEQNSFCEVWDLYSNNWPVSASFSFHGVNARTVFGPYKNICLTHSFSLREELLTVLCFEQHFEVYSILDSVMREGESRWWKVKKKWWVRQRGDWEAAANSSVPVTSVESIYWSPVTQSPQTLSWAPHWNTHTYTYCTTTVQVCIIVPMDLSKTLVCKWL